MENDSEVAVFLVNKKGEIDKRTRREVREMLQEPRDRDWNSEAMLLAIDNAQLLDFDTLEDAERCVAEMNLKED